MNHQVRPADRPAHGVFWGMNVRRLLPLAMAVILAGCAAANAGSVSISSTDVPSPSVTASASALEETPSQSPAADTLKVDHLSRSQGHRHAVSAMASLYSTLLRT